ncbi:TonB-dependent receptor [Pseudoduganella sp. UC29_106]|uniref:TonB-dependent receptor n=1 Tax=Pseudoduganella sp. UC29_106 TaxID=3374553 RepID=UPI0037574DF4
MRYSISRYIGQSAALAICLLPALAFGQQNADAANPPAELGGASEKVQKTEEPQNVVIVTGVTRVTTKKNATFSINTMSAEDIQRVAPMSTADLLSNLPGIYAEGSTAGEASNNITVRGLPVVGGYRFAPQLIDGLPAYEEPEAPLMNNDVFIRDDLMTESIEAVKGGPGGILYSNGLGATVNHISRTGGDRLEGGYKIEYADYGFIRQDAFVSGPLNRNVTGAVGGFYRRSNGIRDTGYTADRGGQIRGNLVYTSDDRTLTARVDGLAINDRTAFYQNLPISVPRLSKSGTPSDPTVINQDTVQPLGIDFAHGTTASPNNRFFNMIGEYGTRTIDQADGIHPDFKMLTLKVTKDLESGLRLSAGARHTGGSNGFNAVFTGNDTNSATNFLNARFQNDVISPAHSAALSCNLTNAKLIGYFKIPSSNPCGAFANISRDDFVRNYAKVTGVAGAWLNDGSAVKPNDYLNFLIPFVARVEARSDILDLKAQKTFEAFGTHDLTMGVYGSRYTFDPNFQASLMVGESAANSRLADLKAVDASGKQVGPSLTRDSAILPGWFGFDSHVKADGRAAYFLDHWETMGGKLKIDGGVRWQEVKASVNRRDRDTSVDMTPAGVVVGSTQDTAADDAILVPGKPYLLNRKYHGLGWSLGANYSFSKPFAVYGLVSRAFRLPSLEDLNNLATATPPVVNGKPVEIEAIEHIRQYETGLRYLTREFGAAVAVFYNDFTPRSAVNVYKDLNSPSCATLGGVTQINSCPDVAQLYKRGVKNLGTEIELSWRPGFAEGLELKGSVLAQKPEIKGANYTFTQADRDSQGVITGYHYVQVSEDGRRPRRLAKLMANFMPSYDFKHATGVPLTVYGQYQYTGSRFSEATDTNVTLYPSYYVLNLGAQYQFSERLTGQLFVANATNQLSFTEGDPLFVDLTTPDGTRNRGVARPLFGRTFRVSLTYRF